MGDHGAGSSAGGPPAGAVVVLIPAELEAAAPAAPPAGAAAGARRQPSTLWTTRVRARVTWVGAAAPRGRAPPPPAWTSRLRKSLALAAALYGCAAAALAFVAMIIIPLTGTKACVRTDAEVASLRTASGHLLQAATALMFVATIGLLVPVWPPVAVFGPLLLEVFTSLHAFDVLQMLITCHGSAHGADAVSLR